MIYVDTNILAAYYCPEPLSTKAQRILQEQGPLAVNSLAEVELVSALARKVRSREMRLPDAQRVLAVFQSHLERGTYIRLVLDRQHFAKAHEWLATFRIPLRTLDALHAAVAALEGCPLVTADAAFAKACGRIGVTAHLIR